MPYKDIICIHIHMHIHKKFNVYVSNFIDAARDMRSHTAYNEYFNILSYAFAHLKTDALRNKFSYDMYKDTIAFYNIQHIFNADVCALETSSLHTLKLLYTDVVDLYADVKIQTRA